MAGEARKAPDLPRQTTLTSQPRSAGRLEGLGPEFCLSQVTEQLGNLHHLCSGIRDSVGAVAPEGGLLPLCTSSGLCAHRDMGVSLKGH